MKKFINKLLSKLIAQQSGDIVSLHKGSVQVLDAPKKSASAANQTAIRKDSSGTPKAALRKAIERGDFSGKPLFVPDVSKFDLELNGYNPALLGSGITSRLGSTKVLTRNRNRRINRYLTHMYLRLLKNKSKKDNYAVISMHFVNRSNSYLIAALLSQNKNAYRNWSSQFMLKIINQVNDLRAHHVENSVRKTYSPHGGLTKLFAHVLKFHRSYIPKGNGKTRPLGVPAIPWRIFTKMLLLPVQLINPVGSYQHGFIPRRGTPTAWNQLSKEVTKSRNIYEIDFEGFFPSVQPEEVTKYLYGTAEIRMFMEELNESKPSFGVMAQSEPTPETLYTEGSLQSLLNEGYKLVNRYTKTPSWLDKHMPILEHYVQDMLYHISNVGVSQATVAPIENKLPGSDVDLMSLSDEELEAHFAQEEIRFDENLIDPTTGMFMVLHPEDLMNSMKSFEDENKLHSQAELERTKSRLVHSGLPQGSPLSPFLSICVLDAAQEYIQSKFPDVKWLFYADDGLFYSDNDRQFEHFLSEIDIHLDYFGIKISKSKSRIIKQNNEILHESIKFLGIRNNLHTGEIYSETRKGNSLMYDFKDIIIFSLYLADENNIDKLYKKFVNFDKSDFPLEYILLYLYLMWKMDQWPEAKRSVFFNRFLESLASDQKAAISRFIDLNSEGLTKALAKEARPRAIPKEFKEFTQPALREEVNSLMSSMLETPKEGFGIFEGPFGGLIQSRLYLGSRKVPAFNTPTGSQDFVYRFVPNSLGHILASKGQGYINLANGSSYAAGEMVRICRSISEGKRLRVFRAGPIKS